jgi:hypothetical protein
MKPQELLERRNLTLKQYRMYRQLVAQGDYDRQIGYEMGLEMGDPNALYPHDALQSLSSDWFKQLQSAVCYWWDDKILRLAVASPLPPNFTVPKSPYPNIFMAWEGSDNEAWASLIMLAGHTPMMLAPESIMKARYPGYEAAQFVAQLLIFLDSDYVTTEYRKPHGKAALRRTNYEGVHFVILRQPKTNPRAALNDHGMVDWQSRWMVRGHYRNQWYAATKTHRTIWVASYIKGPADKPIREPIYRVAR